MMVEEEEKWERAGMFRGTLVKVDRKNGSITLTHPVGVEPTVQSTKSFDLPDDYTKEDFDELLLYLNSDITVKYIDSKLVEYGEDLE